MTQYEIEESQDYLQFKDLFTSSDLEFHLDKSGLQVEGGLGGFVCRSPEGEILAGTALAYRKGYYILNDIAVREDLRGQGLGRVMLEKSLDKLRRLGAETCYLTAKTPKFFEKYGFDYLDSKEAPDIFLVSPVLVLKGIVFLNL